MLANIRKYLSEDLKRTKTKLHNAQKVVTRLEEQVNEGRTILDSYKAMKNAKNEMVVTSVTIGTIIALCGGVLTSILEFPVLVLLVSILGIGLSIPLTITFFHKIYPKYKANKNIVDESTRFAPTDYKTEMYDEYLDSVSIKAEFLLSLDEERLRNAREDIEKYEKYINAIWDTLQSDDIVEKIKYYHLYFEYFEDALLTEWQSYLDEISKMHPEDIYLDDREYLKKVEPIKLYLTPKREKSHNLAIK